MNYRYFLAIFALIAVIAIAWILQPDLPVPVLAEPVTHDALCEGVSRVGEARESTNHGSVSIPNDSRGGQRFWHTPAQSGGFPRFSVSYGTLVMPTPLELPENYYQAQGKVLEWRKHHGFWIP